MGRASRAGDHFRHHKRAYIDNKGTSLCLEFERHTPAVDTTPSPVTEPTESHLLEKPSFRRPQATSILQPVVLVVDCSFGSGPSRVASRFEAVFCRGVLTASLKGRDAALAKYLFRRRAH